MDALTKHREALCRRRTTAATHVWTIYLLKFLLTATLRVLRIGAMKNKQTNFSLDELCTLLEMHKRTIRYYIQHGLVDRPDGIGKGSSYSHRHLEQLLAVRKWKEAGLSLERIQELLGGQNPDPGSGRVVPPPRPRRAGAVEVWSHLHITDGVELHIEPQRSGLTPDQVRSLCQEIIRQFNLIKTEDK